MITIVGQNLLTIYTCEVAFDTLGIKYDGGSTVCTNSNDLFPNSHCDYKVTFIGDSDTMES
ncbi:hypothetical protein [Candidatus Tisiphia endosymbiont of Ditula angustiorana]|uniref:hypothetical protein n=1 Tax=Candidatus Tisiphia endosymbiont of Ditula angustiorana TaxID=3066272 RepID=UPI00312C6F02